MVEEIAKAAVQLVPWWLAWALYRDMLSPVLRVIGEEWSLAVRQVGAFLRARLPQATDSEPARPPLENHTREDRAA